MSSLVDFTLALTYITNKVYSAYFTSLSILATFSNLFHSLCPKALCSKLSSPQSHENNYNNSECFSCARLYAKHFIGYIEVSQCKLYIITLRGGINSRDKLRTELDMGDKQPFNFFAIW